MTKTTSITVTLDPQIYAVFQEAVELTEGAGAKVSVAQLVQHHLQDDIRRQNPRKIAQRFLKSVVRQINVSPGGESAGRKV